MSTCEGEGGPTLGPSQLKVEKFRDRLRVSEENILACGPHPTSLI